MNEAEKAAATAAETAKAEADAKAKADADAKALSLDPVDKELERVNRGRTERDKAEYSLKMTARRIVELGGDPTSLLGTTSSKEEKTEPADDTPVTVGMLKERDKSTSEKTADQLADAITDEKERELVKYHLANTVTSGTPEDRVKIARGYVNSVRSSQIAEEAARKGKGATRGTGNGAPGRTEEVFEPTHEEQGYMKPPFNLTKEQVLAARKASQKE